MQSRVRESISGYVTVLVKLNTKAWDKIAKFKQLQNWIMDFVQGLSLPILKSKL